MKFKVAAVQMSSTDNVSNNLRAIEGFVKIAVSEGAKMICLPENCTFIGERQFDVLKVAEPLQLEDFAWAAAPIQSKLSRLAREHEVYIIAGGIPIKSIFKNKVYQSQLVFNDKGEIVDYYHKIHLFDVDVAKGSENKTAETYHESDTFLSDALIVNTPITEGVNVGLTICYDLRFPELYRQLCKAGANVFTVPASFTKVTGKAHWMTLLKARAIENLAYVIAPAQYGKHVNGRETYGYSTIIDPWGRLIALKEVGEGVITADLHMGSQAKLRQEFPCLSHAKLL